MVYLPLRIFLYLFYIHFVFLKLSIITDINVQTNFYKIFLQFLFNLQVPFINRVLTDDLLMSDLFRKVKFEL